MHADADNYSIVSTFLPEVSTRGDRSQTFHSGTLCTVTPKKSSRKIKNRLGVIDRGYKKIVTVHVFVED